MITATKTTHRFFTSEDNHGNVLTGSILTMYVPELPAPGALVEFVQPAVGYQTEKTMRGWVCDDQRYAEEGTYVFRVAGAGSEYVEFVVEEPAPEAVDLAKELPSRKAALQWLKVNTGLALADRQMILAEAKAGAFGSFDTTTGNGLRVTCDYWPSNGHYVITVKSLPADELTELAAKPAEFDAKVADLHREHEQITARIAAVETRAHEEAGDRRRMMGGRAYWALSLADCLAQAPVANEQREELFNSLGTVQHQLSKMDKVYRANPWPRYYPAVTNSKPHIHSSTHCQTLHHGRNMTDMRWATSMSGQTEAQAVADLDEALCSVCFPSAPVALREYVSKRSLAEQAERQAEKDARNAKRAAKELEPGEVFTTTNYQKDRVTTVARCKEAIRAPFDTAAELAWYQSGKGKAKMLEANSWMTEADATEREADRIQALTKRVAAEEFDANTASSILIAREARQAGHGATADDIAKMRQNARKRAAKDWA